MTDKPTIDETYSRAGNTSNLTVEADRRGAGDVLIAAGMVGLSPSKSLGMALMRLHSEYDSAARLRDGATAIDVALLAARLRQLPGVVGMVAERASVWGMEQPKDKALSVVLWWLDKRCKRCTGRLFERIPGSPGLSNIRCRACNGIGESHLPHGSDGRRLANFIDASLHAGRDGLKKRLHNTGNM